MTNNLNFAFEDKNFNLNKNFKLSSVKFPFNVDPSNIQLQFNQDAKERLKSLMLNKPKLEVKEQVLTDDITLDCAFDKIINTMAKSKSRNNIKEKERLKVATRLLNIFYLNLESIKTNNLKIDDKFLKLKTAKLIKNYPKTNIKTAEENVTFLKKKRNYTKTDLKKKYTSSKDISDECISTTNTSKIALYY